MLLKEAGDSGFTVGKLGQGCGHDIHVQSLFSQDYILRLKFAL